MESLRAAAPHAAAEARTRKRILIVDDNDDNLDALSHMLSASGYAIVTAVNGLTGTASCGERWWARR